MRTTTKTMALAALLWTGSAWAQDAGTAVTPTQDQLRDRDRLRDPATHDGEAAPDRLREQARDRMHDALREHAALPANAPEVMHGAEAARERARVHEAEAIRAAHRHAARTHAGEPGAGRPEGAGPRGPDHGTGSGSGECDHVREQQRAMEMHGGSMGGHHGGTDGGGTDGGGTHHGGR